jgi:hypothetical protein
MTPRKTLPEKLSEWRPSGTGRHVLSSAENGWTVTITADRADTVGCLVWELALARKEPAPAGLTLRTWAEQTAKRVTGLIEPLVVHEVDEARGEALLRSQSPAQRDEHLLYYELLLRGTGLATLRRYQARHAPGSHREQVPFGLTHEVLARVASDLAG